MRRELPPLNALRAFEAAGRLLSFTRAADELAVTQAAVSHQIKSLEEWLGVLLFHRMPRRLALTDAGRELLVSIRDAFDRIEGSVARARRDDGGGPLTVTVVPSFAAKWLVPRLGRFQAEHPDIEVRIAADTRLSSFDDGVDVAIRAGRGHWPGLVCERLMSEALYPVCSPRLLAGALPLCEPQDLRHHTLLHDDFEHDWRMWLHAAGVDGVDWRRGPRFSDSSMVVQAAVEGQGIALARSALAQEDLKAGRLVRPFRIDIASDLAYYIVCPAAHTGRAKVRAFRDWLMREAAAA
ncbi:LysR family glycine cleavage system transcriptional activator [Stella humosa]|uniref:LysR family glycine cleavage system transcriptional activator n=1 Tax=Stella humosa TaxID=94 RepID=A0A3N1LG92_9PROT|nr:transcriptional regulator GcvA [Stella humosa]ROP90507.1 LysR family glycine cleavage system transcriptional activator [Stella humosa]BBK29600.1 transcriptional regulator GcvA [Stella humosa]